MGTLKNIETGGIFWYDRYERVKAKRWLFRAEYQGAGEAGGALLRSFSDHPEAHYVILIQDDEPCIHLLVWNPAKYDVCGECFSRKDRLCQCEGASWNE
jgi:hypothetical protein